VLKKRRLVGAFRVNVKGKNLGLGNQVETPEDGQEKKQKGGGL